ncbi:MAG: glycosyltransferase [Gemmatimonadaceae bacterium]|jgi:dolichol-phosphate mannosyltransferase|nr:glycosyltransferase [Gemmatimonadaceae bacterium]
MSAWWVLVGAQGVMLLVLLARLAPGRTRRPPVQPPGAPVTDTTVTVMVATLNEAARIAPCLASLETQHRVMHEALVIDSRSTDGTRDLVSAASARDSRIRLVTDDPLPSGWVGKVWALETGLQQATGEWVLGVDADTTFVPGMVSAVVHAARTAGYDVVSFGPRFYGQSAGERWLQPAMLLTLVYRCGAAGATQPPPDRVMANGQCFLAKRSVLTAHGGYAPARASFADDVSLARHLAAHGARVGFMDGSAIIKVKSYESLAQMWREWGRSFDLKDATPVARRWFDVALVWLVQALPIPLLLALVAMGCATGAQRCTVPSSALPWLVTINAIAVMVRLALLPALAGSYEVRGVPFWLSWTADIPAAIRLTLSTLRRPRQWRGRQYAVDVQPV